MRKGCVNNRSDLVRASGFITRHFPWADTRACTRVPTCTRTRVSLCNTCMCLCSISISMHVEVSRAHGTYKPILDNCRPLGLVLERGGALGRDEIQGAHDGLVVERLPTKRVFVCCIQHVCVRVCVYGLECVQGCFFIRSTPCIRQPIFVCREGKRIWRGGAEVLDSGT